ncbi:MULTISPECIES: hypothetical protein [Bacillus]|uniref:hypothetical protein n=1 Tax=Bacillus TaxID=1386 RepID=UPI000425BDDE|nr:MULTISPECIES: hypothetical protein [Bacillus]TYS42862.1 hypothetical protein FZC68_10680 [Bacillus pumilus]
MYFITEPTDLIDKEVGFIHANQFYDATTIVTKDGGILIVKQVFDFEEEPSTIVYNEHQAKKKIYEDSYVKNELDKLGIITENDWAEYELQLKEAEEARRIEFRKEKEERERLDYERLKLKFEGEN